MCEKCKQLDGKIAHYRRIANQVTDEQTLKGIEALIRNFEAEKAALHRCLRRSFGNKKTRRTSEGQVSLKSYARPAIIRPQEALRWVTVMERHHTIAVTRLVASDPDVDGRTSC